LKLIKEKVIQLLLERKDHVGIQIRVIKFLEMLVLSFSMSDVSS